MSLNAIHPAQAAGAATSSTGARAGYGAPPPQPAAPVVPAAAAPAANTPAAVPGAAEPATKGPELEAARQAANRELQKNGRELAFEFDDASGRVIARLIDTKTKEVLRQFPSREALAIAKALAEEHSKGVLLQTNA